MRIPIALLATFVFLAACSGSTPTGVEEEEETSGLTPIFDAQLDSGADLGARLDAPECEEDCDCDTLGCPCDGDADCVSNYCLRTGDGSARVCSEICVDGCSEDGYDCVTLQSSGSDAVRICVPTPPNYCAECERDADCGSTENLCLEQLDGNFCATECSEDRPCPLGAACTRIELGAESWDVCQPTAEVCAACVDRDGDGHGRGDDCAGSDCDDTEISVFEGGVELCDGLDNDCDLSADEDFDFISDAANCGSCGNECELAHATSRCASGECTVFVCDEAYGDCDGLAWNGCETWLDGPDSCGACTEAGGAPGAACGTCETGIWTCQDDGTSVCAGDLGAESVNACGGCTELALAVGQTCGTCESGLVTCVADDIAVCSGDEGEGAINECGGCAELDSSPASPCGTCDSGILICNTDGSDGVTCVGDRPDAARNECGGCATLDGGPGQTCGSCESGTLICASPELLGCVGDLGESVLNACGGCASLPSPPGTACGTCGLDVWECTELDSVLCSGDTRANECDGCSLPPGAVGATCGICDTGVYDCSGGDVACVGDAGEGALDACGACGTADSCTPGDTETGDLCGSCSYLTRTCGDDCAWGEWACAVGGVCEPGQSESQNEDCGACAEGTRSRDRICTEGCAWDSWGAWGICETVATCAPTELSYDARSCGECGEGTQQRARTCRADTCSWDVWGDWGSCDTAATCSPGDTDTDVRSCGNCNFGSQSRTRSCSASACTWSSWTAWGSCVGGGTCVAGSTRDTSCGSCGTQRDVCTGSCNWSTGGCAGEGECAPGAVTTSGCGTCQARECSGSCEYSDTCTDCTCSTQQICGFSCPDGYHVSAQNSVLGCSSSGFSTRSTCTPNCGTTLQACGFSCPSGYYNSAGNDVLGCSASGFSRRTTCSQIAGATIYVCGFSCPSGYVNTGGRDVLGCSSSGFSRRTTCSRL